MYLRCRRTQTIFCVAYILHTRRSVAFTSLKFHHHLMCMPSASPPTPLLSLHFPSYDSLSLISNTLTFFPSLDPLQDFFFLTHPPLPSPLLPPSYLKQGGRNGTDTAYIYRTGTRPINTHRKWQTKAPRPQGMGRESCERVGGGEREGGRSDTNMVFYLYVGIGKHRLKWLRRCFRGDTLSVIMTHRPASCHFFYFFSSGRYHMLITCARTHAHVNKHTHMVGRRGKSIEKCECKHTSKQTHTDSRRQHTHTHSVCHTCLALCLLTGFVPSITP